LRRVDHDVMEPEGGGKQAGRTWAFLGKKTRKAFCQASTTDASIKEGKKKKTVKKRLSITRRLKGLR